ncbi:MAG: hypothetical protein PVG53_12520 [Holophagae bacterium]
MRRLGGALVGLVVAVTVTGCGPRTLDVSGAKALDRTARRMRAPMTDDETARFDEALFYLVGDASLGKDDVDVPITADQLELIQPLGGHTADAIVAEARRRRLAEVHAAIAELEERRVRSAAARRDLAAFAFSDFGVFKRNRGYLEWPVIEVKIDNHTNHMVSMVRFRASLLKPGDHIPWLEEMLDLVFFDGLAPGEHGRWRVEPEQQEWIQLIDPHPDLELVVEATRLEGRGGRLLAASDFGTVEARRLEIFRRTLGVIRTSGTLALDRSPLPSLPTLAMDRVVAIGEAAESPTPTGGPDGAASSP